MMSERDEDQRIVPVLPRLPLQALDVNWISGLPGHGESPLLMPPHVI